MQTSQALGAPKKGKSAFGDITNAAAAATHIVPSEEEVVSAQLNSTCHGVDSAWDARHAQQSLLGNDRHE